MGTIMLTDPEAFSTLFISTVKVVPLIRHARFEIFACKSH